MLNHFSVAVLTALVALASVGCSESSSGGAAGAGGTGGTAGAGGSGGTAGMAGAAGTAGTAGAAGAATIAFDGVVSAAVPPTSPTGDWTFDKVIEGMDVCLRGSSIPCSTTGTDGSFHLDGVPANSKVAFTTEHPDYLGRGLLERVTGTTDLHWNIALASTASMNQYFAGSGCSLPGPTGKGTLYIGAPPGSSVVVTPALAKGIVYPGDDGKFDPTLTKISDQVSVSYAGAVACDIAPGEYDLDFAGTTGTCHMAEGWPVDGHDMRVVIDADSITMVNWNCD